MVREAMEVQGIAPPLDGRVQASCHGRSGPSPGRCRDDSGRSLDRDPRGVYLFRLRLSARTPTVSWGGSVGQHEECREAKSSGTEAPHVQPYAALPPEDCDQEGECCYGRRDSARGVPGDGCHARSVRYAAADPSEHGSAQEVSARASGPGPGRSAVIRLPPRIRGSVRARRFGGLFSWGLSGLDR